MKNIKHKLKFAALLLGIVLLPSVAYGLYNDTAPPLQCPAGQIANAYRQCIDDPQACQYNVAIKDYDPACKAPEPVAPVEPAPTEQPANTTPAPGCYQ